MSLTMESSATEGQRLTYLALGVVVNAEQSAVAAADEALVAEAIEAVGGWVSLLVVALASGRAGLSRGGLEDIMAGHCLS